MEELVALITIFKKHLSPITVPIYAIFEGLLLGGISFVYGQLYEGIVFNAILITVSILLSLLFAYRSGIIKATENLCLDKEKKSQKVNGMTTSSISAINIFCVCCCVFFFC